MSATPDSTLADPQELIADLRRQLAEREAELAERTAERDECKAERDEALQRETATAEVLQVINASPGDLVPVFEAILEKARSLCGAVHGILAAYDGEHAHAVATHGISMPSQEVLRQPFRPTPNSAQARVVREGRPIHIPDLITEALWEREDPKRVAAIKAAGVRTMLFVPLRRDEVRLGWITANRLEVRPFTDKQIALFESFAAQAVTAMENARLLTETREALEQQTATAEVLQVINSSPGDLRPVFDAMLEKALRLCDADFGSLVTYDDKMFRRVAQRNFPPELANLNGALRAQEGSLLDQLIRGENVVAVDDIAASTRPSSLGGRAALVSAGAHSNVWVALRRENARAGAITIYRKEVHPSPRRRSPSSRTSRRRRSSRWRTRGCWAICANGRTIFSNPSNTRSRRATC